MKSSQPVRCNQCGKMISRHSDLARHNEDVHSTKPPQYWCPFTDCPHSNEGFRQKSNWWAHMERAHSHVNKVHVHLKLKKRSESESEGQRYPCRWEGCNRELKSTSGRTRHEQTCEARPEASGEQNDQRDPGHGQSEGHGSEAASGSLIGRGAQALLSISYEYPTVVSNAGQQQFVPYVPPPVQLAPYSFGSFTSSQSTFGHPGFPAREPHPDSFAPYESSASSQPTSNQPGFPTPISLSLPSAQYDTPAASNPTVDRPGSLASASVLPSSTHFDHSAASQPTFDQLGFSARGPHPDLFAQYPSSMSSHPTSNQPGFPALASFSLSSTQYDTPRASHPMVDQRGSLAPGSVSSSAAYFGHATSQPTFDHPGIPAPESSLLFSANNNSFISPYRTFDQPGFAAPGTLLASSGRYDRSPASVPRVNHPGFSAPGRYGSSTSSYPTFDHPGFPAHEPHASAHVDSSASSYLTIDRPSFTVPASLSLSSAPSDIEDVLSERARTSFDSNITSSASTLSEAATPLSAFMPDPFTPYPGPQYFTDTDVSTDVPFEHGVGMGNYSDTDIGSWLSSIPDSGLSGNGDGNSWGFPELEELDYGATEPIAGPSGTTSDQPSDLDHISRPSENLFDFEAWLAGT